MGGCAACGYDWAIGGESSPFGEYDTGTSAECCGDDFGENYVTNGPGAPKCCANGHSWVDASGNCVATSTKPDLIVTDISSTPENPIPNEGVDITVTVKNNGTFKDGIGSINLHVSGPGGFDHGGTAVLGSVLLNPGESYSHTFKYLWLKFPLVGDYEITAKVDELDQVNESNENNNERTETLTVGQEGLQDCSDGTKDGECSTNKPLYCDSPILVNKPSLCGCPAGYADCNSDDGDGCEVNLNTDNDNCGGCGYACATGYICESGVCVESEGECEPGDCDYTNKRYCLSNGEWSNPAEQDYYYCPNCDDHCGDEECNCQETTTNCPQDCGEIECSIEIKFDKDEYCVGDAQITTLKFRYDGFLTDPSWFNVMLYNPYGTTDFTDNFNWETTGIYKLSATAGISGSRRWVVEAIINGCEAEEENNFDVVDCDTTTTSTPPDTTTSSPPDTTTTTPPDTTTSSPPDTTTTTSDTTTTPSDTTTTTSDTTTTTAIYHWVYVKDCISGCCGDICCGDTTTTTIPETTTTTIPTPPECGNFDNCHECLNDGCEWCDRQLPWPFGDTSYCMDGGCDLFNCFIGTCITNLGDCSGSPPTPASCINAYPSCGAGTCPPGQVCAYGKGHCYCKKKSILPTCDSCIDGTVCGKKNQQGQECKCMDINKDGKYEECYLRP